MTNEMIQLETGRKYLVHTFYNFKIGPHQVTYLGSAEFRERTREVFRRESLVSERTQEYFFLDIDLARSRAGFPELYSVFPSEELEDTETVLQITEGETESPWARLDNNEISELTVILKNMGETI